MDDMETALLQWLGEWYYYKYGDDMPLAVLEINSPDDFPIKTGIVEYEVVSKITIPPKYIKFLREE